MSSTLENEIVRHWVWETRYRLFEESVPRIKKCLDQLTEQEVWHRPNGNLSSIGNLILHLNGNVTQYLVHGIGGAPDHRKREAEFQADNSHTKSELASFLDDLEESVVEALEKLEASDLVRLYDIQGFSLTGIGVLTHAIEHFSYHTGQITWYTKMLKNVDLQYYGDQDLSITNK